MTPEERLRALNDADRWTVTSLEPRRNPFGARGPSRARPSFREIFAEVAAVTVMAAIIVGAIALQNREPDPIATTPTPSPTASSLAPLPLISGTITDSKGEPFDADVPVQVMAGSADDSFTLVAATTTADGGFFTLTTSRLLSWDESADAEGLVEFELRATSGREVVEYPFSLRLVEVAGVPALVDPEIAIDDEDALAASARTGLADVEITSERTKTTPPDAGSSGPETLIISTAGMSAVKLGAPVPEGLDYVAWVPDFCDFDYSREDDDTGGWGEPGKKFATSDRRYTIRNVDHDHTKAVNQIIVFDERILTPSGAHVGMTLDETRALIPAMELIEGASSVAELWIVEDDLGQLVFEFVEGELKDIKSLANSVEPYGIWFTDGGGPCPV